MSGRGRPRLAKRAEAAMAPNLSSGLQDSGRRLVARFAVWSGQIPVS